MALIRMQSKELMMDSSSYRQAAGLSRLELFLALSRTPHALLDMTTPCLAALLWLGAFPSLKVVLVGLLTVFAGYNAVYALNDLIDYRSDKKKMEEGLFQDTDDYLDGAMVRHPVAQGLLKFREGLGWTLGWALVAMVGAFILNPVCFMIFIGGCLLEAIYCLMWRLSWTRTIVSGGVKTSGAIAAVYAVDPEPSFGLLMILFLWLFFWEIGGQNIPNDWEDVERDKHFRARTVPVRFGPEISSLLVMGCLIISLIMSGILLWVTPFPFHWAFVTIIFMVGVYLLILPAFQLYQSKNRPKAINLFNKASHYPPALFLVVAIGYLF
ncbi:prenyltransferase, UbiA family [delta proteobacterium NaphS2]|nr:prenyltransferase, UbiA family [delta proteobacterium NaphS2]